jgi:hypothetical protein
MVFMAPEVGLEPTTLRLTAECSAIELLRNMPGRAIPLRCPFTVITNERGNDKEHAGYQIWDCCCEETSDVEDFEIAEG